MGEYSGIRKNLTGSRGRIFCGITGSNILGITQKKPARFLILQVIKGVEFFIYSIKEEAI